MAKAKMPSYMASAKPDMAFRPPSPGVVPAGERAPTPPAQVKITIQVTQVKGPLKADAIKEALEASLPALRSCCQDALKTGVKLPAAVTLTFDIGAGGKVSGPVLPKLPLGYEALTKCLSQAVQNLLFPDPGKKTVAVTVKLLLETK